MTLNKKTKNETNALIFRKTQYYNKKMDDISHFIM